MRVGLGGAGPRVPVNSPPRLCATGAHLRHRRLLHRGGSPWQNPLIESFNARLRDEVLDTELFSSLAEAKLIRIQLQGWRDNRL